MNSFSRWIAWRFLFSSRQRFTPLLTMVALGGVALGVWSLMVVLGVMRGFQQELNKRWIGLNAHLTVTKLSLHGGDYEALVQELTSWPEISEANAVAESEIIIQVPGEEKTLSLAAKLKGVEKLTPSFEFGCKREGLDRKSTRLN